MGWITRGRDHDYGGLRSGGFIPEGEGEPEEEIAQMYQRKEQMWVTTMESMEIVWSLFQGIGAPERITMTGPNPIPLDFDFGEHLTGALEALRTLTEQSVHRLRATTDGGLPGLYRGGILVLCQT